MAEERDDLMHADGEERPRSWSAESDDSKSGPDWRSSKPVCAAASCRREQRPLFTVPKRKLHSARMQRVPGGFQSRPVPILHLS